MQKISIKKNLVKVLLVALIALLLVNSVLTFLNGFIIIENNALREQTEKVKRSTSKIIADIVHGADLSVRGYALTKNEKLAEPLQIVMTYKDSVFSELKDQLVTQQYDVTRLTEIQEAVDDYLVLSHDMIRMVREDSIAKFTSILNEDRGLGVWKKYQAFYEPLFLYEDELNKEAENRYIKALANTRLTVIVLLFLGIPTLVYIFVRLRKDEKKLSAVLVNLDHQNRQYMFDNGSPLDVNDIDHVIDHSIQNFKKANVFIANISAGNYTVEWETLNDDNRSLNENTLAGNLIRMRDHLYDSKLGNDRREWGTSGLTKLITLIQNQSDIRKLGDSVIKFMVQYTQSNQASLFVVPVEYDHEHLQLVSCYAWNKKRYLNMSINKHEGLVGQCWYERQPILLTQVPEDYIQISSGLGDALPRCVYISPIKMNNEVYGVLELASFSRFKDFEIDFINKACESIAACIFTVRTKEKTDILLSQYTDQINALTSRLNAISSIAG